MNPNGPYPGRQLFHHQILGHAQPGGADEVRNRRAEYIVAIEPPSISQKRASSWKTAR